jgi:hypothetical protein
LIWRKRFEDVLPELVRATVARLGAYWLEGSWVAMATVTGAEDFRVLLGDDYPTDRIWQDPAYLGGIIDDALSPESLTPFIERFWRLFGLDRIPA